MRALLRRLPFAAAITLALLLKLVLLFALYKAFFAAPQVKKMRMPTARVEQHLLNVPAPAPAPAPALTPAPAQTQPPAAAPATHLSLSPSRPQP